MDSDGTDLDGVNPRGVDVVLAGSVFCDLVFAGTPLPAPGEEVFADGFAVSPGGVATRAVACARLGLSTVLVGRVGTDMFGERVAGLLGAEPGLDLRWLIREPDLHTALSVAITGEHDRSFLTYEQCSEVPPPTLPLPAAAVCNVGLGRGAVPEWIRQLRAAGTRVYGGVGWDPSQQWSPDVFDRVADADVVCVNDVEAAGYTRTDDPDEAARTLAEHVAVAVVTLGPRGVVGHDARTGEHVRLPAVPVTAVDPTGAGDVFLAALMFGGARGWDLRTTLQLGTLASAVSVTRLGGALGAPTPADLAEHVTQYRPDGDWCFLDEWANA